MKKILLGLLLVSCFQAFTQKSYTIKGTIEDYQDNEILISSLYGHLQNTIDTIKVDSNGFFELQIDKRISKGLFRLTLRNRDYIDLIFANENIEFHTTLDNLLDSLQVKESVENKIYYEYHQAIFNDQYKIELLGPLLMYYPDTDDFYTSIITKFKSIQDNVKSQINKINTDYSDLYANVLINAEQDPILNWNPEKIEQKEYLKVHFLDPIDFNNIELMQSDIFPSKVIQFFSIYRNNNISQEQQGEEYIKAIDIILSKASVNKIIFDYVFEYILDGFERFEFENVINFMADARSLYDLCTDDEDSKKLNSRIEKYKQLNIGKPAPEIVIENNKGKEIKLSEIESEYTLILFWASWCTHCEESLPKITALYDLQITKKLNVLAISLDENKKEWLKALEDYPTDWIHCSQLKGWDSPVAEDYNIYATPTMLLLDKDKNIIAKLQNTYQLEEKLIEHNIFN